MGILFLAVLLWFFGPRMLRAYLAWRGQSPAERAFATRFTVFTWVLAFIFIGAFLFLPNKGRVILLVPLFLASVTLAKWWQNAKLRIRREAEAEEGFVRARRIN